MVIFLFLFHPKVIDHMEDDVKKYYYIARETIPGTFASLVSFYSEL